MKTQFLLSVFFAHVLSSSLPAETSAHYSVICSELHNAIHEASEENDVGGEWDKLVDGNFVAITLPDHPWGGDVFEVFFYDIPNLPGYKYPELLIVGGWLALLPRVETEFREYEDGTKACYGYTQWSGQTIYIYAWTEKSGFATSTGIWNVTVTWGDDANINDPGIVLDRIHLGTLPRERPHLPFNIISMEILLEQPILKVSYDYQAWFWLETSTDLKTWKRTSYHLTPLPNTETYQNKVKYLEGIVLPIVPIEGDSANNYFRLTERN